VSHWINMTFVGWRARTSTVLAFVIAMMGWAPAAVPVDPARDAQWHLDFLHVGDAQRYSQGEGVIVGVVDTGVDASHPDLAGSVLPGLTVPPATSDPHLDIDGHGTKMAGLIAAHGRAIGIAPKAKILPIKQQDTSLSGFAGGIRLAVDHGATVLCLAYSDQFDSETRDDVQYAIQKDVVVVAGVGNTDGRAEGYPAGYPGVVGAAGTDRNGNHAAISVISENADIAAPAVDIYSTDSLYGPTSNGYRTGSGTSDATAIIAGAAALVRAKFPKLSAVEVIHRLTATADDKGPPGRDDEYGYGIVNLVSALTADVPPLTPSATPSATEAVQPAPARTGQPLALIAVIVVAALGAGSIAVGMARRRAR
jgi:type VII secretion-associated serine protease mycosin